jgi:hypothetical protein
VHCCCDAVVLQIPFDSTVRISMDTNLCMIKENPDEGPSCTLAGRWYRCVTLCVTSVIVCVTLRVASAALAACASSTSTRTRGPAAHWLDAGTGVSLCVLHLLFQESQQLHLQHVHDQAVTRRGAQPHTGRPLVQVPHRSTTSAAVLLALLLPMCVCVEWPFSHAGRSFRSTVSCTCSS